MLCGTPPPACVPTTHRGNAIIILRGPVIARQWQKTADISIVRDRLIFTTWMSLELLQQTCGEYYELYGSQFRRMKRGSYCRPKKSLRVFDAAALAGLISL